MADLENPSAFNAFYEPLQSELSLGISSVDFDYSGTAVAISEAEKADLTMSNIGQIIEEARAFYFGTADYEGRGRFPGQDKYDVAVGGHAEQAALIADIADLNSTFTSWDANDGAKWRSVFGIANEGAPQPAGGNVQDDTYTACPTCIGETSGHEEFLATFSGNTITSPFQDGHYIYAVIPGGGTGHDHYPPVIYVADLENPSAFNAFYEPLQSELSLGISSVDFDYSGTAVAISEAEKADLTMSNIGQIIEEARAFYFGTADYEGRGRFPGQDKYDVAVGGHADQAALIADIADLNSSFTSWANPDGADWRSVFGIANADAPPPAGGAVSDDTYTECGTCPGTDPGHQEFLSTFSGNTITSPFQDGHYIYAVIAGGGTGDDHYPPVIYVADLENPSAFNAVYEPLQSELSLGISSVDFDYSGTALALSETERADLTMSNIGQIIEEARAFYFATADDEGRGRFPGQDKYDVAVGGHADQAALIADIADLNSSFTSWANPDGADWRSVFGIANADAPPPAGGAVSDDTYTACGTCPGTDPGHQEFLSTFSGNTITSPFQDGHYIYAVIAGGGTGDDHYPPVIYVADLENPSAFNAVYEPLQSELSLGISSVDFDYSGTAVALSETERADLTMSNIGQIIEEARAFYFATADDEGRGRFPGQDKYDVAVGGHADQAALIADIADLNSSFTSWAKP